MVLDFAMSALAVLAAHLLRNYVLAPYIVPEIFRYQSNFRDYWWLLVFLPVLTILLLQYYGHYRSQRVRSVWSALGAIVIATIGAILGAIVLSFVLSPRGQSTDGVFSIFSQEFVSRGVLLLYGPLAMLLLAGKTFAVRSVLLSLRNRGYNTRNMILVGDRELAEDFLSHVDQHPYWGFQVTGLITDGADKAEIRAADNSVPVVGSFEDLFPYLEKNVVDDVVFIAGHDGLQKIAPMLRGCEEMGIRSRLPVPVGSHRIAKPVLESFDDLPVITFNPVKELGGALLFKYTFDRIAAAVLLLVLSPLLLIISLLIKATAQKWSDPVFYGQTRCGLNGRQFTLWKFRSMEPDADAKLDELTQMNEMTGPVFKMRNDPRVTRLGRWLRKTSLDELPQLWNVLVGQMSLVGPRPPLPQEVARYDRWQRRRLSMKPGITCIWQVSGRNELSFETWMQLDLEYIDNWSLGLDFKILCKTVYVVATGYGAM